jgi:hypothetical protein
MSSCVRFAKVVAFSSLPIVQLFNGVVWRRWRSDKYTVSGRRFEGGRGRWGWLSDGRQFLPASVCPLGKCENL